MGSRPWLMVVEFTKDWLGDVSKLRLIVAIESKDRGVIARWTDGISETAITMLWGVS